MLKAGAFALLASVLCGVLLLAPAARAAPTWLPPQVFSDQNFEPLDMRVAVTGRGEADAVWHAESIGDNHDAIGASGRVPGGTWTVPPLALTAGVDLVPGSLALGTSRADGATAAAWQRTGGPYSNAVDAAFRPDGGTWGSVETISAADNAIDPDIAVAAGAAAGAVWISDPIPYATGDEWLRAAFRTLEGEWLDPENVTPTNESLVASHISPMVRLDASGDALAVWVNDGFWQGGDYIKSALKPADRQSWSRVPVVPGVELGNVSALDLAVNDDGAAVAAWRNGLSDDGGKIRVALGAGTWGGAANLADTAGTQDSVTSPSAAIDGRGNAIVAWGYADGGTGKLTVQARIRRSDEQQWGPSKDLITDLDADTSVHVKVGVNPQGRAVVVVTSDYEFVPGGTMTVWAAVGSTDPGADWSAPVKLAEPQDASWVQTTPDVAVDSEGNAIAGWTTENEAYVAALDGAGPGFTTLDIPAAGTAGSPVSFSATVTDVWSDVLGDNIVWDFGDGTTATGSPATHPYATAGAYPITVTATDAAGNSSQESGTIVVAPGPQPGPQPEPQPQPQPGPHPPSVGQPPAGTRMAALSNASMKVRCRRGKGRLGRCARGGGHRRVLVTSFTASEGAKVKISLKAKSAKRGGKRGKKQRTVLTRTVTAKAGANRVVLPLPAAARGALTGELSVAGTTTVRVRGIRPVWATRPRR